MRRFLALLVALFLALPWGCGTREEPAREGRLLVVATVFPWAAIAEEVGGERVRVVTLLPAGSDPHHWEPAPRDLDLALEADVFIANGLGLEPFLARLSPELEKRQAHVIELGRLLPAVTYAREVREGVTVIPGRSAEKTAGEAPDPHLWLDPVLCAQAARILEREFAACDPGGRTYYAARAKELAARFEALHRAYAAALEHLKGRDLVVAHPAFGYLARRYGLRQVALTGLAPEGEPDPRTLAAAVSYCRARGVEAVFTTPPAPAKECAALARETGARILTLHTLASPVPGAPEGAEALFSLMEKNLTSLKEGLGT